LKRTRLAAGDNDLKRTRLAAGDNELKRAICGVALHPQSLRRTGKYASFRWICAPCI